MRARISSVLHTSADEAWSAIKKSKTLLYVTRGFLGFKGADNFPEEWIVGQTVKTKLVFFGVIPGWNHQLQFKSISNEHRELCTEEGGGLIAQWNHLIKVTPTTETSCFYTDEIDVKAGILTPLVWLYANIFYRYRQRRWKKLIKSGYSRGHHKP